MKSAETHLRVRYAETDQMGVVYYANYLVWMEVARTELCRACGFNYRDVEEQEGLALAVAEATCRYASPARYDDEVTIRITTEQAMPKMMTFQYEMFTADRKIATGSTRHVIINRDRRPARLPEKYLALFR